MAFRVREVPLKAMSADDLKAYRQATSRRSYEKNLANLQAKRAANREQMKEYSKAYYAEHREEKLAYHRAYNKTPEAQSRRKARQDNPEFRAKHSAQVCDYIKRNQEKVTKRSREWRTRTDWNNKYHRKKWDTDLSYKLRMSLRNRLYHAIRNRQRSGSAVRLLGCSIEELIKHLENQFLPGMTWQNRRAWHIDHREPLAGFDLTDPGQIKAACHYTNLQPLWAAANIKKGARRA